MTVYTIRSRIKAAYWSRADGVEGWSRRVEDFVLYATPDAALAVASELDPDSGAEIAEFTISAEP